jgi:hypothetical protein
MNDPMSGFAILPVRRTLVSASVDRKEGVNAQITKKLGL